MGKFIKHTLIAITLLTALIVFGNYASNSYADVEKLAIVNNIYAELMIKSINYYFDNNSLPPTPESVGISAVKQFTLNDDEKSADFFFERRIEITSSEIIVSFGPGLEGDETRTLILRPPAAAFEGSQWSCTEGTLSTLYRPEPCRK